jgi:hypothetical protein
MDNTRQLVFLVSFDKAIEVLYYKMYFPVANPMTLEFTTTTPALYIVS